MIEASIIYLIVCSVFFGVLFLSFFLNRVLEKNNPIKKFINKHIVDSGEGFDDI